MVIFGNNVHRSYNSFTKKHKTILRFTFYSIYILTLADLKLFKCLIAIKCSESRVETLQTFHICMILLDFICYQPKFSTSSHVCTREEIGKKAKKLKQCIKERFILS